MGADEILTRAKSGAELPEDWVVFPLLRNKIIVGLSGWLCGMIFGLGAFLFVSMLVIPENFVRGVWIALFTILLLGVLLFIGIGSIWIFISDIRRLREADKHMIVITPEDFVKQEGSKITHVPLVNICHVTARGQPPPATSPAEVERETQLPRAGDNTAGFLLGRTILPSGMRWRRKRMRTPTSLAFIDTRNDDEVTVVNDSAFGDPFAIAAILKKYAASMQQLVR